MKISTEIGSAAALVGETRAIELYGKAGFDAWDFSMMRGTNYSSATRHANPDFSHPFWGGDALTYAKELRHIGEECGMVCNQAHAPFPVYAPEVWDALPRALECAAVAGAPVCVVHPDNYKTAEENAEMYAKLLPYAKDFGVKIAVENMWLWDKEKDEAKAAACSHHTDFLAHIEAVGDPHLVACLDIGHAEMRGLSTDAPTVIRTLGPHLAAIHMHDNNKWKDSHILPFTGLIDFPAVIEALRDVGYRGDMTMEVDRHLAAYGTDRIEEGMRDIARAARRLREMFLGE